MVFWLSAIHLLDIALNSDSHRNLPNHEFNVFDVIYQLRNRLSKSTVSRNGKE